MVRFEARYHVFVFNQKRLSPVFFDVTATHVALAPSLHATGAVLIDVDADCDLGTVVSVKNGTNQRYSNKDHGCLVRRPDVFGTASRARNDAAIRR